MKKNICIILLSFYIVACFHVPNVRSNVVPAVLLASAVGSAMLASSVGSYYAKNGEMPEYVSSASSSIASAADRVFQPAYLAVGPMTLMTVASMPHTTSVFLAKDAVVSAKIGDIVDHVKNSASSAYSDFKALLASNSDTINPDYSGVSPGAVVAMSNGVNYKINSGPSVSAFAASSLVSTASSKPHIALSGGGYAWMNTSTELYKAVPGDLYHGVSSLLNLYMYTATQANEPATLLPSSSVNYDNLKNSLSSPGDAVADDVRNVMRDLPAGQLSAASSIPSTAENTSPPPSLTAAEVQAAIKANTAAVAQAAADAAAATAAANPDDPQAQLAAAQAAVEAAKAAAEAAEAEQAQPDDYTATAPSRPIPDLATINFQPIIDAKNLTLSKAPFTWLSSLPGLMSPLNATPTPPVFQIDLGFLQQTVDLSIMNPLATSARAIISFVMQLTTIFLMIKIFRSM